MEKLVDRPLVRMKLVGEDGNAFAILGRFRRAAQKAGWTKEDLNVISNAARFGDYDHLLRVIMAHIEDIGTDPDEDEDDFENEYEDD